LLSSKPLLTPTLEHEPEYFRAVKDLSDSDLASFSAQDLESVRVAASAYGLHIFGKVKIPAASGAYIQYKLHSIHTEEVIKSDGDRVYRAIFKKDDELEWFDT
jgi:hypothetical protein